VLEEQHKKKKNFRNKKKARFLGLIPFTGNPEMVSPKFQPRLDLNFSGDDRIQQIANFMPDTKDKIKLYLLNLKNGFDPHYTDMNFHNGSKRFRSPKYDSIAVKKGYERTTPQQLNEQLHYILNSSLDIALSPSIKKKGS